MVANNRYGSPYSDDITISYDNKTSVQKKINFDEEIDISTSNKNEIIKNDVFIDADDDIDMFAIDNNIPIQGTVTQFTANDDDNNTNINDIQQSYVNNGEFPPHITNEMNSRLNILDNLDVDMREPIVSLSIPGTTNSISHQTISKRSWILLNTYGEYIDDSIIDSYFGMLQQRENSTLPENLFICTNWYSKIFDLTGAEDIPQMCNYKFNEIQHWYDNIFEYCRVFSLSICRIITGYL